METREKTMKEEIKKFDFSQIDFDVLREREQQEALRRREEMERVRREQEAAEAEPPPVIFSEEEHNNAVQESFEKGKEEGLRKATQEQNQEILELVKAMVPQIQNLIDSEKSRKSEMENAAIQMAVLIAKKIIPSLMENHSIEGLEQFILDAIAKNSETSRIKILVCDSLKEVIQQRISVMFDDKAYEGSIDVIGNSEMTTGMCRIEWDNNSGIEYDSNLILEKVDEITKSYFNKSLASNDVPVEEKVEDNGAEEEQTETIINAESDDPMVEESIENEHEEIEETIEQPTQEIKDE